MRAMEASTLQASLISGKVLIWQIGLGMLQVIGLLIAKRVGLLIAFISVVLWSLSETHGSLLVLQLIVQTVILLKLASID